MACSARSRRPAPCVASACGRRSSAHARASRQAAKAEIKLVTGVTNSRRATLAIHGNANSLAASTVTPITAPATTHEPTLPSAAWSASDAASPQTPTQNARSSPPRPSRVQTSKASSAPSAVRTTRGPSGLPRVRFHPHAPDRTGIPKAATRPTDQISPNASRAPTGPQALGRSTAIGKAAGPCRRRGSPGSAWRRRPAAHPEYVAVVWRKWMTRSRA